MLNRLTTPLIVATVFVLVSCSQYLGNDAPAPTEKDKGLRLTVSEQAQKDSNFCKKDLKEIPEDPTPPFRFTSGLINSKLASTGLNGWMHGVVKDFDHFVFTYRKEDPKDFMAFFKAEQFSLVPGSDAVRAELEGLNRHDKIKLFGRMILGRSPFRHLIVNKLEVMKRFEGATVNEYEQDFSSLAHDKPFRLFGKVHATAVSEKRGVGIVLEHGNLMVPVIASKEDTEVAMGLYRNDIVELTLTYVKHEGRPPHFITTTTDQPAIKMVDRIVNCHGDQRELTGFLVKFKKSPAISTDVYAVRVIDSNGIGRNYTFFPATEEPEAFMKLFSAIKSKAEAAWDGASEQPSIIRNYWKKDSVRVKVSGMLNVVSLEQANPQIYIDNVDALEISAPE